MKVGMLYPSSNAHPKIGIQYFDGLKKCLALNGLTEKITLLSESIGFGGAEKEVYQKAEKLLVIENVDVLVAYLDLKTLIILEPLVFASGKLMIVVNAGANYPENWVPQPNIIFLTLQHSFLCWLNGRIAAQKQNKNALLATSFYDCGYLHSAAMVKNFMGAGGNITYNYVNNQAYNNNFHINELLAFLSSPNNDTDNLLCVFDTAPAQLFYQRLAQFVDADKLHLFVSPMMLESAALNNLPLPFSIEGFTTCDASLMDEANADFLKIYTSQNKQLTNIFTLQGWETALVLKEIYLEAKGNYDDGESIVQALTQQPIASPRGAIHLDEETHYYTAPFVHQTFAAGSSEPTITLVDDFKADWTAFTASPVEGVSSGWVNTYLCY